MYIYLVKMPLFYALESGIVIDIRNKKKSYIERKGNDMKVSITIEDGTSKSQLIKAIRDYATKSRCTVLRITVFEDHTYTLLEFDGIVVTRWYGNIDNFIRCDFSTMRILSTM